MTTKFKLIAHAYRMTPTNPDESPRMSRLAWVVLNDDNKLIRGFDFYIDPTDWGMTEPGAVADDGATFDRLYVIGHAPKFVIEKFICDYEHARELFVVSVDDFTALLTAEARRYHIGAREKPDIKHSLIDRANAPTLDLSGGVNPLIAYFTQTAN